MMIEGRMTDKERQEQIRIGQAFNLAHAEYIEDFTNKEGFDLVDDAWIKNRAKMIYYLLKECSAEIAQDKLQGTQHGQVTPKRRAELKAIADTTANKLPSL